MKKNKKMCDTETATTREKKIMAKKLTEDMAARIGNNNPIEYNGETYFLLEDAHPDVLLAWDKYVFEARAVRVGDEIDEDWGMVPTHTLYWEVKTPKDLGYRICDTTEINGNFEQREMRVDNLQEMYGSIHIYDDGEYIPIEEPKEDDGIISCLAVRFDDDLDDDGDIRIYSVSWFAPDDEIPENVSQHNGRKVVDYDGSPGKRYMLNDIDVNGYQKWQDRSWYVLPEDACDWETPFYVDERTDYMDLERYNM